jgi:hypothetical protein
MLKGYIKYRFSKDPQPEDVMDNNKITYFSDEKDENDDEKIITKEEFYKPIIRKYKDANGYIEFKGYSDENPRKIIKRLLSIDHDILIEDAKLYYEMPYPFCKEYIVDIINNVVTIINDKVPFKWDDENNTYKFTDPYSTKTGHIKDIYK